MLLAALLLAASATGSATTTNVVGVDSYEGQFVFLPGTDEELDAKQFYRRLRDRDFYRRGEAFDVLKDERSSDHCLEVAISTIRRAGFAKVRVRAPAPSDWFGPRPPEH